MIAKESYGLQNRRNRRKNQLQSSQEMVNAVDKVSVSVRRAFNVNRLAQDNLDNKVWTLERECRKSLGLLSFEQRKFMRSLKPSMTGHSTDGKKHSNTTVGRKLAGKSKLAGLNSSKHLPALVDGRKFQSNDPIVRRHYFSYQDCFEDSKDSQTLSKQESAKKVNLPFITESKKSGRHKRKKTVETKDKHVSSWNVDKENDENHCRINVKDMKNLPSLSACEVSKDSLVCDGGTNKMQTHTRLISENHLNPRALHNVTESRKEYSLPSRKIGLNCETHPNVYNYVNKNTEVRVKEFLKLPPIGGIRESPIKEPKESGQDVEQLQEEWIKKFRGVNTYQSVNDKDKALWKNLVHCRYLRIGDQHQPERDNKTCQCNWCAMMKKLQT